MRGGWPITARPWWRLGDGVVSAKARDAFERALKQDPKAVKPQFYLARAAEQDGDRETAVPATPRSPPPRPRGAWLPMVRDSLARLDGTTVPPARPGIPAGIPA